MPVLGAGFAAAMIAAVFLCAPGAAQEPDSAAPPAADAPPAAGTEAPDKARPGLPGAPGRIGRVRRDDGGRLVPDGPSPPTGDGAVGSGYPAPPPAVGGVPMNRSTRPGTLRPPAFYDPRALEQARDQAEHEIRARRRQMEIDIVLREEKQAKADGAAVDERGLTAREAALIAELGRMDRDVRDHEMAHYFAAQPHSAFPEYWYVSGPLSRRYAVSGITRFDASEVEGDIAASLRKLQKLRQAALAPRAPSDEDRRVAGAIDRLIESLRSRPEPAAGRRR
ncbi:MAG: hypothetical protein GEU92_11925 [Alphaproteobacteria bacterium]|nr:hypothetical protein [Alphaproteobacteria bacterium]